MQLRIRMEKKEGDIITFNLAGSLDADTYMDLERRIKAVLDFSPKAIILNMEELSYISSRGLEVIFYAKKAIEAKGGVLMITNLQPQVRKVFNIVATLPDLKVFANTKEADEYFSAIQQKEIDEEKEES